MISFDRFERSLPELLDELAAPQLPDYTNDLFARTAATRQRPGWTFPERWTLMSAVTRRFAAVPNVPWRLGAIVAMLALVAALVVVAAGARNQRVPAPFGPAANGVIAYVSGGDVYVGDPAGGAARLVVGGPANDRAPMFSPDGTQIHFIRDEPSIAGDAMISLFVVRADGSDLRQIRAQLRDVDVPWLAWTPDSRRVALVHMVNGTNQLDIIDASGNGSVERLSAAAGLDSIQFRPPNGQEIMFRACLEQTTAGRSDCGLYRMNADGTNVHQLAEPATDGDTLDLTGAVYSADGSQIYFNRWTPDASFGDPGCCHLFVMNADGTDERHFIPNTAASGVWDGFAVVSPDGTRVAFTHNSNKGVSVVNVANGSIIQTGPQVDGGAFWMWAPDSSKILMYPDDGSASGAYLLDPDGGPWTQLPWTTGQEVDWQRLAR